MGAIVLFDGICNFCNGSVNFIIARDPGEYFKFATLQSDAGRELREKFAIGENIDSIILIEDEAAYMYSSAPLRVASRLSGAWWLFGIFRIVPKAIRDYFYRMFARNRYKLFGRKEVCMVPTPEIRARFLSINL
ncbi:MAG: DCC1-like thiol-disulfide oxidoreductase family protein [Acidobacteriota bacterium]